MQSGSRCAKCKQGRMLVYKTVVIKSADLRMRHLKCNHCGHTGDKNVDVIPLRYAPYRGPRVTRPSKRKKAKS